MPGKIGLPLGGDNPGGGQSYDPACTWDVTSSEADDGMDVWIIREYDDGWRIILDYGFDYFELTLNGTMFTFVYSGPAIIEGDGRFSGDSISGTIRNAGWSESFTGTRRGN